MGWRVSWYKADKNEPLIITHEVGKYDDEWDDVKINGECICHNNGTEFWQNLKYNNEDFKKEIKCLFDDPDCDYYSITKEGFKMIILEYRQRVIDYMKASLDLYQHPEEKESRKHWFTVDLVQEWEHEIREWEHTFLGDNDETCYFNIDLSDKKRVSGSWMYKFAIFDMIFIYKTFDWDNYTMVVYGG